jgi:hypothetical protein
MRARGMVGILVHTNTARITEDMRRLTDSTSSPPSPAIVFSYHYIFLPLVLFSCLQVKETRS